MPRIKRLNGDTPSIVEGRKVCSMCHELQSTVNFCRRTLKTGNMSYRSRCKKCEKMLNKTPERRVVLASTQAKYRKGHPEVLREIKRRYYATDKGKQCKRREDHAFTRTGGRAKAEAKRAAQPLTIARATAKLKNQAQRRAGRVHDELSLFVLSEAYKLAKQRRAATGKFWEVDHVIPVAHGGTNRYDNLQVVPKSWNRQKSHRNTEKYFGA